MQKIKTTAVKFGTFVSPDTGSILYVDPSHADEAHTFPQLSRTEAAYAFERGLIEDPDGAKTVKDAGELSDPNAIAIVAAERLADTAKADADASDLPSALSSRQTTAWQDPERVLGAAEGYADGVRVDDDADAPPARPAPAAKAPAGKPAAATPAKKPAGGKAKGAAAPKATPTPVPTPTSTPVPRLGTPGPDSTDTSGA